MRKGIATLTPLAAIALSACEKDRPPTKTYVLPERPEVAQAIALTVQALLDILAVRDDCQIFPENKKGHDNDPIDSTAEGIARFAICTSIYFEGGCCDKSVGAINNTAMPNPIHRFEEALEATLPDAQRQRFSDDLKKIRREKRKQRCDSATAAMAEADTLLDSAPALSARERDLPFMRKMDFVRGLIKDTCGHDGQKGRSPNTLPR